MQIKQIKNLKNKTVLLRGDVDVPLKNGKVADDFRLERLLPTIEYLNKKGAKIIIMGHLGRPKGKIVESLSVKPMGDELQKLMRVNKKEIRNWKLEIGDFRGFPITENIFLLENLRFNEGEEKNDLKFAKKLAELGDVYINDAFANSHRKHASIVGITKYLPSYAGLNLEREITVLKKVMENPKRPAIAIMGGAKMETKLPLINKMSKKFDYVLVGGKLSLEIEKLEIKKLGKNIILPVDYAGDGNLDIGRRTIKFFSDILMNVKTVIWNGPLGMFEDKRYMKGTKAIAEAIVKSKAYAVTGGGDVISALDKLNMTDEFDFISTGGGAMLEFLEKGTLIGIEALELHE